MSTHLTSSTADAIGSAFRSKHVCTMSSNNIDECVKAASNVAKMRGHSNNAPEASTLLFFDNKELAAFNIWAQKQGDGHHLYKGPITCAITIKGGPSNVEVITKPEINVTISGGKVNHLAGVQAGSGGSVTTKSVNKKITFSDSE
ncbi:MAG TPA: hypothetical protein VER08_07565 [Pyrinomonadaceae bacterium]|nr:hypothetical protein [Pyrinomonadaceae bacterium]